MTKSDRLQHYLDELAAHRESTKGVNEVESDPALQEVAAAITELKHPVLPSAVDTRFQALLMPVSQSDSVSQSVFPTLLNRLDEWRTILTKQAADLWSQLTSQRPTGRPAVAVVLILLFAGILLTTLFVNNSRMKVAQVTAVVGQAEVMTDDGWIPLKTGAAVQSGQRIRTDSNSSATVRFFDGTETIITADTDATLTAVSGRLGGVLQVAWTQLSGTTKHDVVPLRGRSASYQVETPGGTLLVQGTSFSVAVQPDGQTLVSVAEGQVNMTGLGETVTLQAGQATVAGPALAPIAPAHQFAGQGELKNITGTLWTIGNLPVTVISQTVIAGDPVVGDFVSVNGRILPGNIWLADVITVSAPGASSFQFTAPIAGMGLDFWQVGIVTVAVTNQTQLIGNLEVGTLARVTFTVLSDDTLVTLEIEEIGGPLPTPTATATLTTTVTLMPSGTATATATVTPAPTMTPMPPIIINCYKITFLGVDYHSNNTSTWTYHVAELPCAQDLSNWMVALPSCAVPVAADPIPWEIVNPDPNYHLSGVKWEVGNGFKQGVFTVTVNGHWSIGITQIGVKGPDVGLGLSAGPICVPPTPTPVGSVTPTATPSMTPVFTPTATITATATMSVTMSPTFTATPIPPTATQAPPTSTPAPSTQPPPTQPPPPVSGNPIVVNDNDQTRTFTCNGNSVTINGNKNSITLLGNCGAVTIRGNGNWVSIQSASSITNTGNENTIVGP